MKKMILVQAQRCCWLPLAVMCMVLPVRADTMSVTVNTPLTARLFRSDEYLLSGPQFVVNGFNASLGTLTEVMVSYGIEGDFTTSHPGDFPEFLGTFENVGTAPPLYLAGRPSVTSGAFDYTGSTTFSDPSDLSHFASSSQWDATGTMDLSVLPAGITFTIDDDQANFTVTYDYTPLVASTPEPASLFLLGTIAACALAIRKRRLSSKRQETN